MNISLQIFIIGVVADLVSTLIGLGIGLTESNPIGAGTVLIVNATILLFTIFIDRQLQINKHQKNAVFYVNLLLLVVGIIKIYFAYQNYYTITEAMIC